MYFRVFQETEGCIMRETVIQRILDEKVIAIVRGYTEEECLNLAKALHAGGVNLMEVTFDPKSQDERERTVNTLRLLNREMGDKMLFGAGTVTTTEMVQMAWEGGAKFIISPDMDPAVIKATIESGMVSIPGALTPTEIKQAHACGADFVKVFPVSNMGVSYVKAVCAPLSNIRMLAVGGVDGSNVQDYLAAGAVGAGVASCLFKKDWIKAGQWDRITEASKTFVALL